MTTDSTPTEPTAIQTSGIPPQGQGSKQKRPVLRMILAGVAVVAAIGLGA
jgi:hypothetical protein